VRRIERLFPTLNRAEAASNAARPREEGRVGDAKEYAHPILDESANGTFRTLNDRPIIPVILALGHRGRRKHAHGKQCAEQNNSGRVFRGERENEDVIALSFHGVSPINAYIDDPSPVWHKRRGLRDGRTGWTGEGGYHGRTASGEVFEIS